MKNLILICRFTQQKEAFSLGVESCLCYTDRSEYSQHSWCLFWFTLLLVEEELNCRFLDCIFQVKLSVGLIPVLDFYFCQCSEPSWVQPLHEDSSFFFFLVK